MVTKRLTAAVLLAGTLLIAACGGGDEPSATGADESPEAADGSAASASAPVYGGELIIGLEAETNSWLPGEANLARSGLNVTAAIYDPLMAFAEDNTVQPFLAESIEANADFTEFTLRLRRGVRFHDGEELTAEVLKDNFDTYLTAEGSTEAARLKGVTMEVVDPLTVVYRLAEPNAAFPELLAGPVGWPFSSATAAELGDDAGANPVGTGPFRFVSWQRDSQLVVERNDQYWRTDADGNALPYLERLVFRPIPDEDTRLDSLEAGDVDVVFTLRQSLVAQARELAEGDGFDVHEWVGNNASASIMNVLKPPLDDVRIRRAIALGHDQSQVIEVLGGAGISPEQTQYFSEDSPYWSAEVASQYPEHDPEAAAALVEEYRNDPARSDGKAVGDPVTFSYYCSNDASLVELTQVLQAFWSEVGFDVEIGVREQSANIEAVLGLESEPRFQGTYDVQCWRLGQEGDPYQMFSDEYGPWESSPRNYTNYSSTIIDEQLEVLRTTGDSEERRAAVEAISLDLVENLPQVWHGSAVAAVVTKSTVQNLAGWTFPDGTPGDGIARAVMRLDQAWVQG